MCWLSHQATIVNQAKPLIQMQLLFRSALLAVAMMHAKLVDGFVNASRRSRHVRGLHHPQHHIRRAAVTMPPL